MVLVGHARGLGHPHEVDEVGRRVGDVEALRVLHVRASEVRE